MTNLNPNNKRIAKNTIYLTIRMVFVLIVSLYTSRVFLNVLGVEDFGISNVVSGFVTMFTFIRGSLSNATQRFYNFEMGAHGEDAVSRVYSTSIVIQFVIGILIVILLESIGLWYFFHKMVIPRDRIQIAFWLYQLATISCFFSILQVPYTAAVMAYERMNFYALLSILEVILKLCFALCIPYVPIDRLLSYGLFTFSIAIISFVVNIVFCKKKFKQIKFTRCLDRRLYKKMLSFTGWNAFGAFSNTAREQGLNMILNLFFGPVINAARGIAYQVTGALNGLVQTLSVAAQPQIMQSYAKRDEMHAINLMFSISKLGYTLMFVMAVPISLEIDYILNLWLGPTIPQYTNWFIRIVLAISLINILNAQISTLVHASGKMRNYQVITSLYCLLVLPISYLYLKHFQNPIGVFAILFFIVLTNYFISLVIIKTLMDFPMKLYFKQVVVPIFMASIVSVPIPIILHKYIEISFIRLIIVLVVSAILTCSIFALIATSSEEKNALRTIIFQKFSRHNK